MADKVKGVDFEQVKKRLMELLIENVCGRQYCEDCEYYRDEEGCVSVLQEKLADHLIANGVTVQQWIKAEEQPPEKYKKVLVKDRITGEVTTAYWGDFDCFVFGDGRGHGADLWMPLPQ